MSDLAQFQASWRRGAALTLTCLVLWLPRPVVADTAPRYPISLPAGALHDVLLKLATELEVSLFFARETVAGIEVEALEGEFTLPALFDALLADVCLQHEFVRERLVAISPGCPTSVAVEPSAPEPAPVPEPDPLVEEVLVQERYVTGSRIRNPAFGHAMPLDIIDATEIRLSGYQAVGELLRYVPAVAGNSASTLISNGGDGTATVTLRGLPASNTLVLLNGRRLNTDALKGSAVDLNTLPLAMVDEIQILKDGVSAIYGSDAIAGVVNIITKQDIDGVVIDVYSGQSAENDLQTENFSILFGGGGSSWRFSAGLNRYDQSGVRSADRPLSASSDDRSRGGIDKRSSATGPARFGLNGTSLILDAGLAGTSPADFRAANSEDRFEYRDFTSSIVPSERISAFTNATWDFSDSWQAYLETMATQTRAETLMAPVPLFTAFESIPLLVEAGQTYNPFGEDIYDVRRRFTELPARRQSNSTRTYRAIAGARHFGDNVNVDFAMQYNRTRARESFRHGLDIERIDEALRAGCVAPCVPLNLFGQVGSITPEMLNFVGTSARIKGTSEMFAMTLDTDWLWRDTMIGDVELSSGLEYRRDKLSTEPDDVLQRNALAAGGNRSAVSGSRDIVEAYAEAFITLLEGRPAAERLDMQLAMRVSRYSDFGVQVNPRLVVSWQFLPGFTWRSSIARGFRAPTLQQLYGAEQQSFEQLNDLCSVADNVGLFRGCSVQSDPSLTQFLTITGGEDALDPERSRTFSTGIIWQRRWAGSELGLSMDWYNITQEDVVDSSAQFIINQNARYDRFSERVTRNADGNISRVQATLQNIGQREVNGLDFTAHYSRDHERFGRLTVALNATHIAEFKDKFDPDSRTEEKAGTFSDEASGGLGALPDWKWNLGVSWQAEHWQAHYNIYHVSDLEEEVPLLGTTRTIESWTTHNANLNYLGPMTRWFRITAGVNNLFDEDPPFSAAAFNDSYDGRTYDITGRYYFLKLEKTI